jgi:hypothetical protein
MTMRQWCHREQWRPSQVQAAIAEAMKDEPEGPDRDYWTTQASRDEIKAKYDMKKYKPKPVTVTLLRECCGKCFTHVLKSRESAKRLTDYKCRDPECRNRTVTMPFGKYAWLTVALVYEQDPSYLAWFHETVDSCDEIKEAIRALDDFEAHLTAYRARRRQVPQKILTPTQQQVEWLMGKFSASTVDLVCEELFGREE